MKVFTATFAQYVRDFSSRILRRFRTRFYRFRGANFTLLEALSFPMTVDGWIRYSSVIGEISKKKGISTILEVGSGGEGISAFLSRSRYEIYIIDINKKYFKFPKKVNCIICDGTKLPFKNSFFDVVVSVDTIEHIQKTVRASFMKELKRVTKGLVIIHTPLVDKEGMFSAKVYDVMFNQKHLERYGFDERNIAEHIKCIHPTLAELQKEFPDAYIHGLQNCDKWYKYMSLRHSPLGLLAGLFYLLFLKKSNFEPPFYSCLLVYEKND